METKRARRKGTTYLGRLGRDIRFSFSLDRNNGLNGLEIQLEYGSGKGAFRYHEANSDASYRKAKSFGE